MATTLNSSGVQFPDGTTQTTAAGGVPAYGAIGSVFLCADCSFVSTSGVANTTYAGSNLNYFNGSAYVNAGFSGTWRTNGAQSTFRGILFVRIA